MSMPISIVIGDATSPTPVNHTFTPVQDGPESKFVNSTGANLISTQETLAVEVHRPKTDTAQGSARVVIWDPKEGNVSGQTVFLYGNSGAATFKFAPGASLQEKKDVVKMLANSLINADIVTAVTELKPFI